MTMPETTQSDLVDRLRELDAAATPGPWAYRPDDMDDWGIVKSPRQPVEGFEGGLRCCLAQFRHPEALDEEVLNSHRRAKTDPWQGNAELVTFLRNAVPDILGMADEITHLRAHCEAMEKALGLYTCHPCPVCNGDCGSANPPVLNCPTQAALNAFGGWDAYRKEDGA